MRSFLRSPLSMLFGLTLVSVVVAGCSRGPDEAEEDIPIVVEESGPIALGEGDPTADEIQVVSEEPVVTRTVIVRERPVPRDEPREEPRDFEPRRPARPNAVPAGTRVPIALLAQIDSEHNDVGESWTGRVTRDVVVNGVVVIPSGAAVSGVVTSIIEGDRTGGQGASITLEARSIETVAGSRSIAAAPVSGGHTYENTGFPTKETAIGAGAGAVIGGIVGGKKGAAIGAGVGGAGGAAMGQARDDYEVAMNAGTELTLRVTSPIIL
ncbi:MAG TPA: glycine zipper domain-containing protein [Gemmatimonadota bacterium]|nr:glycine zipper domain-containing protein [Gemmatimonadota bacterium]